MMRRGHFGDGFGTSATSFILQSCEQRCIDRAIAHDAVGNFRKAFAEIEARSADGRRFRMAEAGRRKIIAHDAIDDRTRKAQSPSGSFVADAVAGFRDVRGDDVAAILENNRIRRGRRHGQQEENRDWRHTSHRKILAKPRRRARIGLPPQCPTCYSRMHEEWGSRLAGVGNGVGVGSRSLARPHGSIADSTDLEA